MPSVNQTGLHNLGHLDVHDVYVEYPSITDPSCALPQALSSWEQAHAGEGRVLSDAVWAVWSLGKGPQHAVPAFFASFLARYLG